jgi:hypothetical protein
MLYIVFRCIGEEWQSIELVFLTAILEKSS